MKNGSKFLRLALVGVLGAAIMIGCSDDNAYPDDGPLPEESSEYDENGCRSVVNEETGENDEICDGSTTVAPSDDSVPEEQPAATASSTESGEETTTTTVPRPTTTVKKTTAATAPPTNAPSTQAPTTAPPTTQAPTTAPPTTQAPTTAPPTTQAPTTAPPTTLPPVNVRAEWSGSDTGCPSMYPGSITLDVTVTGGTSPQVSVSVQGNSVSQPGPSYVNGAEESFWFSGFPSSLPDGSYTVNISVSDSGRATTNLSKTVVYDCV